MSPAIQQSGQTRLQALGRPTTSRAGYRRDIDGLRAIAVMPVVIFHIAQSFLPGGYVGVDIFFVISGYLISAHILTDVAEGRFNIARFYERRIRRIFPAYAVLLCFVVLGVLFNFLPVETRDFGKAMIAAVASVTNIFFWATTGYFAVAAEQLPLLHTWSLAVEEQFYLVFPVMIMTIHRWARDWLTASVVVILLLSLTLSIIGAYEWPLATFYLLPTRAWELLLGTALALKLVPPQGRASVRNVCAAIGLLLIVLPMVLYSPATHFPGAAAIPPCLGAALIIHAGESGESMTSRLLSLRPLVFIGLISYSLYLWHWPLMVFQRTDSLLVVSSSKTVVRSVVLITSLVCATLSWLLVERPTRNRAVLPTAPLMAVSGGLAASLVAAGIIMIAAGGFPGRFSPAARAVAAYLDYDTHTPFREGRCFLAGDQPFSQFDRDACLPNVPGRKTYLLFGDSHAAALSLGLEHAFPDANVLQVTAAGCAPLEMLERTGSEACPYVVDLALNLLPNQRKIDAVWLAARWKAAELPDLLKTIDAFRKEHVLVVLIGPSPEYQSAEPRLLAKVIENHDPELVARLAAIEPRMLDETMLDFAAANKIPYISIYAALCPHDRCIEYAGPGVPLFFDEDHLTAQGSIVAAGAIRAELTNLSDKSP
jgi:peptidoglycan/LPS O-acetylase OafA/YrhL